MMLSSLVYSFPKESELIRIALTVCLLASLLGCQKKYPDEIPVFPITAIVTVDGVAQEGLQFKLHDESGGDPAKPTFPSGFSTADGVVTISTYANGDGAPEGSYKVTVIWGQLNPLTMAYGGPDKLNGRYSDVEKSEIRWTVTNRKLNDMGTIELVTQ